MAGRLPDHSLEIGSETVYRCLWTFFTDRTAPFQLKKGSFSGKNLFSLTQKSSCCLNDVIVKHDVNNQSNDVIGNEQNMTTNGTMTV